MGREPIFTHKPRLGMTCICLALLSCGVMLAEKRFEKVQMMRARMSIVITPLQYLVDWPARLVHAASLNFSRYETLRKENITLKANQLKFQTRLNYAANLEKENRQLRELLLSSNRHDESFKAAHILSLKANAYRETITIDKGERAGVYVGQALMDAHGIMGQIMAVNPLNATALLISDAQSLVPIKIARTGERGLLAGGGHGELMHILHMPKTADIQAGDSVLTSGLGQRYPEGYPIGEVTAVKRPVSERFIQVKVAPKAAMSRGELVLLIWPQSKQEKIK